ncbi:histidine kinase [Sphingobacterium bambusae]|uniref:Histidine kinase n=1 Tax=Sphingobacterium bambusae TaxID=662858 RepID=A0ABW6BIB1_9SPHI|nr:histidine kinase [Sphingobacterium bambusae]WPL50932.1 histidine kinase [Sphingobacterium bambusae]
MKRSLFIAVFCGIMGLQACKKAVINTSERDKLAQEMKVLDKVDVSPENRDSLLAQWKYYHDLPAVKNDTVLLVDAKYRMARLYAMEGNDSARIIIEQAVDLIEPTTGNMRLKALVYNGMGNIRNQAAKANEAGYYYNKAAAIVLSDSSTGLSPEARSVFLLSAAQSNHNMFQYDLCEKMNRAALLLSDSLPEGHINKQRVLVQMIQVLYVRQRPVDSIANYLTKLEALHSTYPGRYNTSYLYDAKIQYFELKDQADSVLHYQVEKAKLDEALAELGDPTNVQLNNLFVDYCNIAAVYVERRQADKARACIARAQALLKDNADVIHADNMLIYYHNVAAYEQLTGRPNEAIRLLRLVAELQKGIYQTENTQAIAEMNALYQLQTKDRSIQTLNESIKINKLQLQQNRLWLAIVLLFAVILALSIFFLYYGFRQRRLRQEKQQMMLQQQLLRTQMEPHFIFNTLAAVQSFVRLDKKEQAIKYLNRFSRLLRSSLELSREHLVPLSEEIDTLENYLSLQQMRCEDAFLYTIEKPYGQDLTAVLLPPMLIQPYVENAILHGIDLDSGNGKIEIDFSFQEQDLLVVRISDSGKTEPVSSTHPHKSLSGAISQERINLLGKKAMISSTDRPDGGKQVVLHIPLTYA